MGIMIAYDIKGIHEGDSQAYNRRVQALAIFGKYGLTAYAGKVRLPDTTVVGAGVSQDPHLLLKTLFDELTKAGINVERLAVARYQASDFAVFGPADK